MTFYSLASSSRGNAYLVSDGDTHLLLECGLAYRTLRKRCPVPLHELTAVLLTHEHGDHAKCAEALLERGLSCYMSEGTARALNAPEAEILRPMEEITLGALEVKPFPVYHDAAEPFGWLIYDRRTEEKLLFATDTRAVPYVVPGLTMVAVECNYSEYSLSRNDRMPEKTKNRIRHTHMEEDDCLTFLRRLDLTKCTHIYLMHMSSAHGRAQHVYNRFSRAFPGIAVEICKE